MRPKYTDGDSASILECLELLEQQRKAVGFGFDKDLVAVVRRTLGGGEL